MRFIAFYIFKKQNDKLLLFHSLLSLSLHNPPQKREIYQMYMLIINTN